VATQRIHCRNLQKQEDLIFRGNDEILRRDVEKIQIAKPGTTGC
jgi:hypothetical protein